MFEDSSTLPKESISSPPVSSTTAMGVRKTSPENLTTADSRTHNDQIFEPDSLLMETRLCANSGTRLRVSWEHIHLHDFWEFQTPKTNQIFDQQLSFYGMKNKKVKMQFTRFLFNVKKQNVK